MPTTINGTSGNDNISNSAAEVIIYAYGGKDTIYNTGANVSLDGGTGDDSINNRGSKSNVKGGDGKDTISVFDNEDSLEITGAFSTSYNSSKREIYFKVGTTAKAITFTDFTSTTFHVNNDTYQISGNKFIKK